MNITLITSIINISNKPLSYTTCRSVYTKSERFDQTKYTIETIKKYIPDNKIYLVECSDLTDDERKYFVENTDIFFNIYDLNNTETTKKITDSASKSLCEGTMTILALQKLFNNNIPFKNLFKVSGRYYLNEKFNYDLWNNENIIVKPVGIENYPWTHTTIYKLPYDCAKKWLNFLLESLVQFNNVGYEQIFSIFLEKHEHVPIHIIVGICGNVSGNGIYFSG